MKRGYWIVAHALVVAGGVILMFVGCLFREGGVWYNVCCGIGVALISVGTVALVYEVMARQQMLTDFKLMLENYTGAWWVKAAGVRWVSVQDGKTPELIGDGKCPTRLRLAALDSFGFFMRYRALVLPAVEDGTCESLEVLFQDPESDFAKAMDELQPGRLQAMINNQESWRRALGELDRGRPRVSLRLSSNPVLGGLVIAEVPARSQTQAIWSPYVAVRTFDPAPTFDVAGPDAVLFIVLEKHFENLWKSAMPDTSW